MALKLLFALAILATFSISAAYSVEYLPMFDKDTYSIGEFAIITVQDYTQNNLPGAAESIFISIQSKHS